MSDNRTEIILEFAKLEKERQDLEEEREVIYDQYRGTIEERQRLRLKRQLDDLDQEIDELKTKINNLDNQLYDKDLKKEGVNRRILALENKLSKINFKEQVEIVKSILNDFVDYGAALFFINNYLKMAGDLFCLELQEILNEETTDLLHYPIEFSIETTCDEVAFLEKVGNHIGINDINKKEDCSKIIEKLLGLIESGSIILIELKKFDLFDEREIFLSWLVNDFWQKLTENIPLVCQEKDIDGVKFIIVINSDDDIFEEFSNQPFCCQTQCFNMSKIFAIFLENWTERDIKLWLKKYPGLSKTKSTKIAKSVYRSSEDGIPSLVRNALRSKLS